MGEMELNMRERVRELLVPVTKYIISEISILLGNMKLCSSV